MEDFKDVLAFHQKFDLPRGTMPQLMRRDAEKFRRDFLAEEVEEFDAAWKQGNLVKTADALLDFVYVAIGTALFIGCPRTIEWPNFRNIKISAVQNGLVQETYPPRLLPTGLQITSTMLLRNRIDFFINAYDAARNGEEGAMNLALYALRLCCNNAYSIAAMMNVPWGYCWRHVQEANMRKKRAAEDGSDSKRKTLWDVVKPQGWTAPDVKIAMELQLAGWKAPSSMLIDVLTGKVELPYER